MQLYDAASVGALNGEYALQQYFLEVDPVSVYSLSPLASDHPVYSYLEGMGYSVGASQVENVRRVMLSKELLPLMRDALTKHAQRLGVVIGPTQSALISLYAYAATLCDNFHNGEEGVLRNNGRFVGFWSVGVAGRNSLFVKGIDARIYLDRSGYQADQVTKTWGRRGWLLTDPHTMQSPYHRWTRKRMYQGYEIAGYDIAPGTLEGLGLVPGRHAKFNASLLETDLLPLGGHRGSQRSSAYETAWGTLNGMRATEFEVGPVCCNVSPISDQVDEVDLQAVCEADDNEEEQACHDEDVYDEDVYDEDELGTTFNCDELLQRAIAVDDN